MKLPTIYVLVNKDLNMSIGKTAAQVAHAASRLQLPYEWGKGFNDTIIVLESNHNQMDCANAYLNQRGIKTEFVIDEGVNEISPHSVTAMAVFVDRDVYPDLFKNYDLLRGSRRGFKLWH